MRPQLHCVSKDSTDSLMFTDAGCSIWTPRNYAHMAVHGTHEEKIKWRTARHHTWGHGYVLALYTYVPQKSVLEGAADL